MFTTVDSDQIHLCPLKSEARHLSSDLLFQAILIVNPSEHPTVLTPMAASCPVLFMECLCYPSPGIIFLFNPCSLQGVLEFPFLTSQLCHICTRNFSSEIFRPFFLSSSKKTNHLFLCSQGTLRPNLYDGICATELVLCLLQLRLSDCELFKGKHHAWTGFSSDNPVLSDKYLL